MTPDADAIRQALTALDGGDTDPARKLLQSMLGQSPNIEASRFHMLAGTTPPEVRALLASGAITQADFDVAKRTRQAGDVIAHLRRIADVRRKERGGSAGKRGSMR